MERSRDRKGESLEGFWFVHLMMWAATWPDGEDGWGWGGKTSNIPVFMISHVADDEFSCPHSRKKV